MENYLTDEEINKGFVEMGMKKQEESIIVEEKPKANYFFPDILGNAMSKVSLQVQYEAGLMSMTLMMVGLIVMIVYLALYINPLWYKIFLIFNCCAGLLFFLSNLTTNFQQYQNYMQIKEFNKQEQLKGGY